MRRLVIALTVFAVACGGSDASTNPNAASIAGTYTLRTINGSPLPFTISNGQATLTVIGDVLTVADGGTWSESTSSRTTVNGQTTNQTTADGGTWIRAGSGVTFTSTTAGGAGYTGTFTGNGFALVEQSTGLSAVFTK